MRSPKFLPLSLSCATLFLAGCLRKEAALPDKTGRVPDTEIILRLHGSNTIGAKMAPALARDWFSAQGVDTVFEQAGSTAEESYVRARKGTREEAIEIWSYGSNTGFNDLAWGKCDIGMSSKPIDNETAKRLAALGDMHSPLNEHIIGLDGIAIIVNAANPLRRLDVAAAAAIFSGRVKDWGLIQGGAAGPIVPYTRDRNSGTFDVFRHIVLGSEALTDSAAICESNERLVEAVAADVRAIGYAPVGSLGDGTALEIASGEAKALAPTKINIATEDYPLSRRLFLYTPAQSSNPRVRSFLEFVQSEAGQLRVEASGFIAQIPRLSKPAMPADAPVAYRGETREALRMAIDFRFHPGSFELDNKARQDLARLARFVERENLKPCRLKLFGFCDNIGKPDRNLDLSNHRAKVVAEALKGGFGIETARVIGFGSVLPIATNATDAGREKNRRIEVWMDCASDLAVTAAP